MHPGQLLQGLPPTPVVKVWLALASTHQLFFSTVKPGSSTAEAFCPCMHLLAVTNLPLTLLPDKLHRLSSYHSKRQYLQISKHQS